MRRTGHSGGFFLCLLLNLLLNWEGALPAVILFALHQLRGWPLRWAGLALALWIGGILLWTLFLGWASKCGSRRDAPRENKNPYSSKGFPGIGTETDKKSE